jgi:hypothetical protein
VLLGALGTRHDWLAASNSSCCSCKAESTNCALVLVVIIATFDPAVIIATFDPVVIIATFDPVVIISTFDL